MTNPIPVNLRLSHTMAASEVKANVGPYLKPEDITIKDYVALRNEGFDEENAEQFALMLEDRVSAVGDFFDNKRAVAEAHAPSSDWGTWYAYLEGPDVLAFVVFHHGYKPTEEDEDLF